MVSFKEFNKAIEVVKLPFLDSVVVVLDGAPMTLTEGKWYKGRFDNSIRIDDPTHGVGQRHAHLHGRAGDEIGAVNLDGTSSHGTRNMRIHDKDAEKLKALGFTMPKDNVVEWLVGSSDAPTLLLLE